MGFPDGASGLRIYLPVQVVRDAGSILELGRSPGGRHGNSLQYSCLKNPHGQRILVGYSGP